MKLSSSLSIPDLIHTQLRKLKLFFCSRKFLTHFFTTNGSHFTQNGFPHFYYKANTRNSNFHPPTHYGNGMQHFRGT
ncbi:hypothetical protein AAG906_030125 [Vitis piasezkii]